MQVTSTRALHGSRFVLDDVLRTAGADSAFSRYQGYDCRLSKQQALTVQRGHSAARS
jgi:hypothetical protein